MLPEAVSVAAIVIAAAAVFVACCTSIAHVAFSECASRVETRLAWFRALAFAVCVVGCLALSELFGNEASALFAVLLCAGSFILGTVLEKSWRAGEAAERARLDELCAAVEGYRASEDSLEARCARVARERDLTRREEEILVLLLQGRTRSEIARELYVSGDTVKTHIRNLYRKLGVAGKGDLVDKLAGEAVA